MLEERESYSNWIKQLKKKINLVIIMENNNQIPLSN
jgi:predicted HAD superfamily phosphohydrolase YqeG